MKRSIVFIALMALLTTGCHRKAKEFSTQTVSGGLRWLQVFEEPFLFDEDTLGVEVTYSLEWPKKGVLSSAAERELLYLCFGDSSTTDVKSAVQKWLATPFFYEDEEATLQPVKSLGEELGTSLLELEGTWQRDCNLATFCVTTEMTPYGAAHGIYSANYLTVDLESGKAVHLADLVTDTNLLCEAIAHAIQDLQINSGIQDCLFDEYRDVERMPLPRDFTIDSARNGITVYYGLYEIAPYACGIQEVTLPIFWLSKHVPLTPYAKRLFGPGCSL